MIAGYYNLLTEEIELLYFDYISNHEFNGDHIMNKWCNYVYKEIEDTQEKRKVRLMNSSLNVLPDCLCLTSSEAVAEKIFSTLEYLFPPSRYKIKSELMEAQMIIKVNEALK